MILIINSSNVFNTSVYKKWFLMNECITWSIWDNKSYKCGKGPRVNVTDWPAWVLYRSPGCSHWPSAPPQTCPSWSDAASPVTQRQTINYHSHKVTNTTVLHIIIYWNKFFYFDRWYSLSTQCPLQASVHYQICLLEKESCNVVYQYLSRIICLVVLGNWGFFVRFFFSILEFVFWGILTYQKDKYFPVF